jgi:hypothetical protein
VVLLAVLLDLQVYPALLEPQDLRVLLVPLEQLVHREIQEVKDFKDLLDLKEYKVK